VQIGEPNVFLAWKSSCTRSHNQAKHFGAKEIFIWPFDSKGSRVKLLARYFVSFFQTLRALQREKPAVIFTLNQPPFLLLAIYLYCRFSNASYVLDSHSAAFNDPKWAWFRPVYRFLAARALININTNEHHRELVQSWGGRSYVIADVPIDHDESYAPLEVPAKSMLVVASFMFDEPLDAVWKAARLCPDVHFFVTGNSSKADPGLIEHKPPNIEFTGYVPVHTYFRYMVSTTGVIALTTRDNTMQMGAYEALSLERPIITSDWPILRNSFGDGAIYVDNSAASIAAAVQEMVANTTRYRSAIGAQKRERRAAFEHTRSEILAVIDRVEEHSVPVSSNQ